MRDATLVYSGDGWDRVRDEVGLAAANGTVVYIADRDERYVRANGEWHDQDMIAGQQL